MVFLLSLLVLLVAGCAASFLVWGGTRARLALTAFGAFAVAAGAVFALVLTYDDGGELDGRPAVDGAVHALPLDIEQLFEGRLDRYRPHASAHLTLTGEYELVAEDIQFATSLTAAPDGRLFVAEFRTGEIKQLHPDADSTESVDSFAQVPLPPEPIWEQGLWNIAVHPTEPFIYAAAIQHSNPDELREGNWRVVRFELLPDGNAGALEDVCTGLPAAGIHSGGSLAFDEEGMLYIGIGDTLNPRGVREISRALASARPVTVEDPAMLAGVIIRVDPGDCNELAGDTPLDEVVYASGFRNPYGLTVASDGTVYATNNMEDCCDQVVKVEPGGNHGWPQYGFREEDIAAMQADPAVVGPLVSTGSQSIAPTEIVYYEDGLYPGAEDSLVYGAFHSGTLHRVALAGDGGEVDFEEILVVLPVEDLPEYQEHGGIVGVTVGSDGYIYFATLTSVYRLTGFDSASDPEVMR